MKEAIQETIWDFEMDLRNCPFWMFKRINYLERQIEHYEQELKKL